MDLAEQVQARHVDFFPLEAVMSLHNLGLSTVAGIPQGGTRPHLIFDFTWSGLNKSTKLLSPMEVMRYGGVLHRILKQALTADPRLCPFYLIKVDLDDVYTRLWVRMEDIPSVAFLILKKPPSDQ